MILEEYSPTERIPISTEDRLATFKKTNFRCGRCGLLLNTNNIRHTVDHIIPRMKGGINDLSNYLPLCYDCNKEKDNSVILPSAFYKLLEYDNKHIVQADEDVLEWERKYLSVEYLKINPMIFQVVRFTISSTRSRHIDVCIGNKTLRNKSLTLYKLEHSEVVECASELTEYEEEDGVEVLRGCLAKGPTYVIRNMKLKVIDTLFWTEICGGVLRIHIVFTLHKRTLMACLYKYFVKTKIVYKAKDIYNVLIDGLDESAYEVVDYYKSAYSDIGRVGDDILIILSGNRHNVKPIYRVSQSCDESESECDDTDDSYINV